MCTPDCLEFLRRHLRADEVRGRSVLEMGALDVNGSVRPLIEALGPARYVGIDIVPGPGVDEICDASAAAERYGPESFDVVVSTEMLEHVLDWRGAVRSMKRVLRPGGLLLITTRSAGFELHHYPLDFWRFEPTDIRRIFADLDIEVVERDPGAPGVFMRARRRSVTDAVDLADQALLSVITGRRTRSVGPLRVWWFEARTYYGRVIEPTISPILVRWRNRAGDVRKGVVRRLRRLGLRRAVGEPNPAARWGSDEMRTHLRPVGGIVELGPGRWQRALPTATLEMPLPSGTWLSVRIAGRAAPPAALSLAPTGRPATELGVLPEAGSALEAYVHRGGASAALLRCRGGGGVLEIDELRVRPVPRVAVLGRTFLVALHHHRSRGGSVARLLGRTARDVLRRRRGAAWRDVQLVQRDVVTGAAVYDLWWRRARAEPGRLAPLVSQVRLPTTFSLIVPLYNTPEPWLVRCLDSVLAQAYPRWEVCIANDASTEPHVRPIVDGYAARDPRIRVVHRERNGNIVAASNSALGLATGAFIGLLDSDDELSADALLENAMEIERHPDAEIVYSDEDKIDGEGAHFEPYFKPDWSPELLLLHMYTAHLSVYRRSLVDPIGWFRPGFDGSQDYDLALRATERAERVHHIPKVLYHWRTIPGSTAARMDAKPFRYRAATRALEEALTRRRASGAVESLDDPPSYFRTHYAPVSSTVTAIVFGPRASGAARAIGRGRHGLELELAAVEGYDRAPLDAAAARARGELLLFVDAALRPPRDGWVRRMAGYAERPGIGVVGCRVVSRDLLVEESGLLVLDGRVVGAHAGYPARSNGYLGRLLGSSNCTATSGCVMIARDRFGGLGGAGGMSAAVWEVDLCVRATEAGLRNVCLADLVARRRVTGTPRIMSAPADEVAALAARRATTRDPYYNPNLDPSGDFSLAWPP